MTEFRPGRFQILPLVIKNLIIINALVFFAQQVFANSTSFSIEDTFALHTWQSPLFKPWQLVTHLFLHGSLDHIFFNMFALWMFGSILENLWGPKRFLIFYIVSGLGAALCHMTILYIENQTMIHQFQSITSMVDAENFVDKYARGIGVTVTAEDAGSLLRYRLDEATLGASGAIFGCLAAFGYLFPNTYIYIYFFLPLKAKWFVLIYIAIELYSSVQNSAGDNVAHVAHLGGALFGLILVYFWNKNNRKTFY